MTQENNLLSKLHKYSHRQDENFITESFVHLLVHLIESEPTIGITLLNKLSSNKLRWYKKESKRISILSQIKTDEGIPDIEVQSIDKLMYIEVKVESDFSHNQIKRYKNVLIKSDCDKTHLTVLTRYPYTESSKSAMPDSAFRWHHIVDWLDKLVEDIDNDVSHFIINQFVNFLKMKGIAMEKISWELINGLKSFNNLMVMLREAIAANKLQKRRGSGKTWDGFYLDDYWVGIDYKSPNTIGIYTKRPIKKTQNKQTKLGFIGEDKCWGNELDMEAEKVHFFALSKESQVQCLEKFIKESVEYGNTLI
tara:strand:+ start:55 stop:978 length:924 start_codon:yes stop_codon:yes gene_type:complete